MSSGAAVSSDTPVSGPGIGVFGGSFNPPHRSHLRIATGALDKLPICELLVLPTGDHPHKRGRDMASADQRAAMARLAFQGMPGVVVDERELHRAGPSYTVDTLAELATEHPGRRLFFLIGSDNLPVLPTWHMHHRLLELATVVTYPRAGYPIDPAALATVDLTEPERASLLANVLDLPADDLAASDLRARWRRGERELAELPPGVADYLEQHQLFR